MKREELTRYLDETAGAGRFRDYCPNGLQVEGRPEVQRLVAGVTATPGPARCCRRAPPIRLLVHHGWFWRGEDGRVTGIRKTRLQTLLEHDINLIAYHLPLDSHPEFGNNAQLARRFGWTARRPLRRAGLGWLGDLDTDQRSAGGRRPCRRGAAARAAADRRRRTAGHARRLVFGARRDFSSRPSRSASIST
jgi:putative NIF3 family GTP cyclohydrolase 1 type 2